MMTQNPILAPATDRQLDVTNPIKADPLNIGTGFQALSFKQKDFAGLMDPLVMVDHFTMTEPTFGTHPHAGMSAVSVLFEDSEGRFNNRDSLGNHIDLLPGDLYWLMAGRGAVHNEAPLPGSKTHALQIFINLPARLKQTAPTSLHVKATEMPTLEGQGYRVRVVLGASNGVEGTQSPTLPLTILDATLKAGVAFTHILPAQHTIWLHPISGSVQWLNGSAALTVPEGSAIALRNNDEAMPFSVRATTDSQFVLIEGTPIGESFIQRGPFVMSNTDEIERVSADYAAGRLGSVK